MTDGQNAATFTLGSRAPDAIQDAIRHLWEERRLLEALSNGSSRASLLRLGAIQGLSPAEQMTRHAKAAEMFAAEVREKNTQRRQLVEAEEQYAAELDLEAAAYRAAAAALEVQS